MEPEASDQKKPKPSNDFLKYSSLGLQLVAGIGLAAWLGYKLDLYLHLKFPAFLLGFVFVSFGGMMYQLYRSINK
ncbi:MAG TPA: AtpZ/AtpI family protein [Cyclobacteriaceae bacterium]